MNIDFPKWLTGAQGRLRTRSDEPWDADDWMPNLNSTATGELTTTFQKNSPDANQQLLWLMMFCIRRVLPCWTIYCDTNQPGETVDAIRKWLVDGVQCEWNKYTTPAVPTEGGKRIVDCRECDTGCVARAAAEAAQFAITPTHTLATCSLSAADMAVEQSPVGSFAGYRRWFIDIAIPAAFSMTELTMVQQLAHTED